MDDIKVRQIEYGSKEYKKELELRNKILRLPLGLDIYDEDLGREKDDMHLGAFLQGKLAGVLVMTRVDEENVRMRQVAVREDMRNRGAGRLLVEYAEQVASSKGYGKMILNARKTAVSFYVRLGYAITSDEFKEVGIAHVEMSKALK